MIEINDAIKKGKQFVFQNYKSPDYKTSDEIILVSANMARSNWYLQFRVPLNVPPVSDLQNILKINKRIFYITVKLDKSGKIIGVDDEAQKTFASEIQPQTA
jgi:hypothetical protein